MCDYVQKTRIALKNSGVKNREKLSINLKIQKPANSTLRF